MFFLPLKTLQPKTTIVQQCLIYTILTRKITRCQNYIQITIYRRQNTIFYTLADLITGQVLYNISTAVINMSFKTINMLC